MQPAIRDVFVRHQRALLLSRDPGICAWRPPSDLVSPLTLFHTSCSLNSRRNIHAHFNTESSATLRRSSLSLSKCTTTSALHRHVRTFPTSLAAPADTCMRPTPARPRRRPRCTSSRPCRCRDRSSCGPTPQPWPVEGDLPSVWGHPPIFLVSFTVYPTVAFRAIGKAG